MANADSHLKVFISYSRRDSSEFADELVSNLKSGGFSPIIDRHDIAPGEDWELRLSDLIEQADSIVFVVSPLAIKSERCAWEIDRTLALSKRLLPIIHISVPDSEIPARLNRLQFIRFDQHSNPARPLAQLAGALRTDLEWIREHTRLGELAARWRARGRAPSSLLRGQELQAAQAWVERRRPDAPEITDRHRAFLAASAKAEAANLRARRLVTALAIVLLFASAGSLWGWRNQHYVSTQWRWFTTVRPYIASHVTPYILTAEQERSLRSGDSFAECDSDKHCPEMIVIPKGAFLMGSLDSEKGRTGAEGPLRIVVIRAPLAVSKFEITFQQWDTCVAKGACDPNIRDGGYGRGLQPVIDVSWDDAKTFVGWLTSMTGKPYRLLSEAEWEYAARARTYTAYPWGNDIGKGNANCRGCGSQWDTRPAPVGSFPPNGFGLFDMHGNVREWVEDCFRPTYLGAPRDGSAWVSPDCKPEESASSQPLGLRVVRGGAWGFEPNYLRSANRPARTSGSRDVTVGFRVARTLAR